MGARGGSLAAALLVSGLLVGVSSTSGAVPGSAGPHAKPPRCTIVGTARADRLVGTPRRDVICGAGGNDVIVGGGGNDVLVGGRGADTIKGGHGRDRIAGGAGDDVLDGGPGADDVDGGAGVNECTVDRKDDASHCVYDRTPARASDLSVSRSSVDVTSASQEVVVRVRVADDTGVRSVQITPSDRPAYPTSWARLVRGGVRDGWWEATLVVPRWARPGSYVPRVVTFDRLGQGNQQDFADAAFTVVDSDPDTELPHVTLTSPTPSTVVDTRTRSRAVTITARITDAKSGVDGTVTQGLIIRPGGGWGRSVSLHLVSGTAADGVWSATAAIPEAARGGTWRVQVSTSDLASAGSGRTITWHGALDPVAYGDASTFADGMGTFTVLGGASDETPPVLSAPTLAPSSVDTLTGPATVSVSVHGVDVDPGVSSVVALLTWADGGQAFDMEGNLLLSAGTAQDGTWRGTVTLPQGVPPGTYYLRVLTTDGAGNTASYQSQGLSWMMSVFFDTTVAVTVVDAG